MTAGDWPTPLTIDVVSDVVCPWCFVGKRRLERALALQPDMDVEIRWRPFQLDPTIPAGGTDRRAYLAGKFGSAARVAQMQARIVDAGREVGIPFAFDAIERSPNTLDAHRLIRWAYSAGRQTEIAEALFRLYFIEGADIGDHGVLTRAAQDNGLDPVLAARLLADGSDTLAVQDEIASAARLGVSGVPFFIFGQAFAVSGAQTPEILGRAIAKARTAAAEAVPA